MYRAIIFDLGNVLIQISHQRILDYWAEIIGYRLDAAKMKLLTCEEIKLETGAITPAVFRRNIAANLGFQLNQQEFDAGWNHIFGGVTPGIKAVISQLNSRYRLIGLSNTNSIHIEFCKKEYPEIFTYFERFFYSHEMKARKPDAGAYQIVLQYLQLKPENVIFIDDKSENIDGAIKLGITGILMESVNQLVKDLHELGINLNHHTSNSGILKDAQIS